MHRALNWCRRHPSKIQPEHEMSVIQDSLMLLNPLNEITRSAKPQLVSFLQKMHLVLSMMSINAMVLVNNIAQHCLSPPLLCLGSHGGDTGKEDEWEFVLAGIAPGGEVALLVDLRQLLQHAQTLSTQVR